jgi:hypothetical protein
MRRNGNKEINPTWTIKTRGGEFDRWWVIRRKWVWIFEGRKKKLQPVENWGGRLYIISFKLGLPSCPK